MALKKPSEFHDSGSKVFIRKPTNKENIRSWIDIAKKKIVDAGNASVSHDTRLHAAYDAVRVLAQAAVSSDGWSITSDGGHHRETLEAACALAGCGQAAFDAIDAIRELRNGQYRAQEPSQPEVEFAVRTMENLVPPLLAYLAPSLKA